jgi:Bifunctional DNA primase/polymerase, N-terminal
MAYPMAPNSDQSAFPEADCFATTDEKQIREWWSQWPEANIGIATDNLLALRVNTAPAAVALGELLQSQPDTPKTVRIILNIDDHEQENHVVFSVPKGANAEARTDLAPGVSVLGFDDVIVGPGSVLKGTRCVFAIGDKPVAPAPLWLLEMCGVQLPESKTTNVVDLDKPAPASVPTSIMSTSAKAASKSKAAVKAAPPAVGRKEAAAHDAAARGFDVFPIRPYVHPGKNATPEQLLAAAKAAKAPLVANWQNLATQDPRQVGAWWAEWPDANLATTTDRFIVVDVDPRNGGKDTFALLRTTQDFPDTLTSNTQSGGQHWFYVLPYGVRVKGGTHKLGQGVDIKSRGGYVLLPGSTIEGRAYAWCDERPIALAPQWLIDRCKAAKPKTNAAGTRLVEEDDTAIEMATAWMLKHAPTAEYGAIDDTTYKVAARLYDFGVSVETATDIMLEWNELKCNPPGDVDRLLVVVESASRNRENAIGSKHRDAPGFEAVEIDESKAPPVASTLPAAAPSSWNEPTDLWVENSKPATLPSHVLPDVVDGQRVTVG